MPQAPDAHADPRGDAECDDDGERGREQGEVEEVRQGVIAQIQQLIARLLEHHGAANPTPDRDRSSRRQQHLSPLAAAQPLRRRRSGERGGDALSGRAGRATTP